MTNETVHQQDWAFPGLSLEEIGSETAVHKGREYPKALLDEVSAMRKACMRFLDTHLGDVGIFHQWLTEELFINAMSHGNNLDPTKAIEAEVVITEVIDDCTRKVFSMLRITDEGLPFNPADIPDPTEEELLENPTGRGVHTTESLAERLYGHKATYSVDASVWPQGKSSGKQVTFQWYREIPVERT